VATAGVPRCADDEAVHEISLTDELFKFSGAARQRSNLGGATDFWRCDDDDGRGARATGREGEEVEQRAAQAAAATGVLSWRVRETRWRRRQARQARRLARRHEWRNEFDGMLGDGMRGEFDRAYAANLAQRQRAAADAARALRLEREDVAEVLRAEMVSGIAARLGLAGALQLVGRAWLARRAAEAHRRAATRLQAAARRRLAQVRLRCGGAASRTG